MKLETIKLENACNLTILIFILRGCDILQINFVALPCVRSSFIWMILRTSDSPQGNIYLSIPQIAYLAVCDTVDHDDTIVAGDTNDDTNDWSVLWQGEQVLW